MKSSILSTVAFALSLTATVYSLPSPQNNGQWDPSQNGGGSSGSGGSGGDGSGTWGASSTSSWENAVATATSAVSNAASTAVSAATSTSTVACNNSPDLCSRQYSNVTHMGAHDAAFLRDSSTDNSVAGNQYYNATKALNAGIRLLSLQVHNSSGTLELCHTTCTLLDAGTLEDFLVKIKAWMDENPNEVVTLLIVNSDDEDVASFGKVYESSNISSYGYTPATVSASNTWPTLQTMIDDGTRLVTFIATVTYSTTYPYLLNEWDFVFETAYEVTSLAGLNCTIDRPSGLSDASSAISSGYLPLMNHFVYQSITSSIEVPNVEIIDTTNSPNTSSVGALGQSAYKCNSEWGTAPVFALVDFYSEGPAIETADNLNGITAEGRSDSSSVTSDAASAIGSAGAKTGALVAFLAAAVLIF
ncbi:plc-like phosphodiesterase [Diaporthe eres]|uniref:PLC-like phosphodiesterase n=1 Tax=Diaporthe vaccinii TaxID=105482 RepID=A0ABR4EYN6_9PEZI|nr:plc-like phosphodiesterase [Diaporthe eres]